jgi:hypothetical protein
MSRLISKGLDMKKPNKITLAAIALALSMNVHATMYKRTGPNGTLSVQDQPCDSQTRKMGASAVTTARDATQSAASDHRAAFREMALAWGLTESLREDAHQAQAAFNGREGTDLLSGILLSSLKSASGNNELPKITPELRVLLQKYTAKLAELHLPKLQDVDGLVAAYENEYTKAFSAQELREIATYYRAIGFQGKERARKPAQPNAPAIEAAFKKSPTAAKLSHELQVRLRQNAERTHINPEQTKAQMHSLIEGFNREALAIIQKQKTQ